MLQPYYRKKLHATCLLLWLSCVFLVRLFLNLLGGYPAWPSTTPGRGAAGSMDLGARIARTLLPAFFRCDRCWVGVFGLGNPKPSGPRPLSEGEKDICLTIVYWIALTSSFQWQVYVPTFALILTEGLGLNALTISLAYGAFTMASVVTMVGLPYLTPVPRQDRQALPAAQGLREGARRQVRDRRAAVPARHHPLPRAAAQLPRL